MDTDTDTPKLEKSIVLYNPDQNSPKHSKPRIHGIPLVVILSSITI